MSEKAKIVSAKFLGAQEMGMPMNNPSKADLAVAHFDNRKVEEIVKKTYREFRRIIDDYGTLSADQIFGMGVLLFQNITIRPLERMSDRPSELRKELVQQLALMLEKGTDEVS